MPYAVLFEDPEETGNRQSGVTPLAGARSP